MLRQAHLLAHALAPGFPRITAPEQPGDETVARAFRIAEIFAALIYLMPREEAVHAENGLRREPAAILKIPRAGDADRGASATELAPEAQPFRRVCGDFLRRNEINVLVP